MTFPYPGDDPSVLLQTATQIVSAQGQVGRLATELASAAGGLASAWQGDVAELAKADMGKLTKALPELATRLSKAATAVEEYQSVAFGVRYEVDDLRARHVKLTAALQAQQVDYGRSGRFAEANDMTPAQLATYRAAILKNERDTQTMLDELTTEYNRQVTKNNTAAHTCGAALKASHTVTHYAGSTLTGDSLSTGLDLGGLQVAHLVKMHADAKNFENDIDGVNKPGLSPAEHAKRLKAIIAKYGADANDPTFATTVATDKGQQYFKDLQHDIGRYQHFYGAQDDYKLDRSFFTLNAQILATATDQSNSSHVSTEWTKQFFTDHGAVNPYSVLAGADYTKTGVHFSKGFLDPLGQSAVDYEKDHVDPDLGLWNGPNWQDMERDRFHEDEPLWADANSNDPLADVMAQYKDHPDNTSTLFQDPYDAGKGAYGQGDLYYLTHRKVWSDGGAATFGDALANETGPTAGDPKASAAIAGLALHDVAQDQDSVPAQLHKGVATIGARYMGDIVNLMADGGMPGSGDPLHPSGLDEGPVGHMQVSRADLAKALHFAYSDSGDKEVRTILTDAWARTAHTDTGIALAEAKQQLADDPTKYDTGYVSSVAAATARTLGLLSGSDTSAFSDDQQRQVELAEQHKEAVKTLLGLVPIPDLPEVGSAITDKVAGTIYDAATDMVKDQIPGALVTDPDADATQQHDEQVNWDALHQADVVPRSVVTAMSKLELPVIYDGSSHGPSQLVATVSSDQDPHHDFTDAQGHLLSSSELARKGSDAVEKFDAWYQHHSYFISHSSAGDIQTTQGSGPYQEGVGYAVPRQ